MKLVIRSGHLIPRIAVLVPNLFTGSALAHRLDGASAERVAQKTSPSLAACRRLTMARAV
jgi:hypothetical protein